MQLYPENHTNPLPIDLNNNIYLRGNRMFHHETMILMAQGNASRNWVLENNVFGPSGGFMIHYKLPIKGFIFRHNTVCYVPGDSFQGLYRTLSMTSYALGLPTYYESSNVQIYNNIIAGPMGSSEFNLAKYYTEVFEKNLYYQRTNTTADIGNSPIVENFHPLKNPAAFDGRLVPQSAAIKAGSTHDPVAFDMYGVPRGAAPTIGAVEYVDLSDSTPPAVPENLAAAPLHNQIQLSWDASTDNQLVAGYVVYRDGARVARTHTNHFTDRALAPQTAFTYRVSAIDPAGNESPPSVELATATIQNLPNRPTVRVTSTADGAALMAASPVDSGPQFLVFDLGADYLLSAMKLVSGWNSGSPVAAFALEYWKNGAWVGVPGSPTTGNTSAERTVAFTGTVRTTRVRFTSASAPFDLNQLWLSGLGVDPSTDIEAPATPAGLAGVAGIGKIQLSWDAAADNIGVTGYILYRDGIEVQQLAETHYLDTGLAMGRGYLYAVVARDAAGNVSPLSPTVSVTTLASASSWAGFPEDLGYVDTGDWMGYFFTPSQPWLWSFSLNKWLYAPDPGSDPAGAWGYFLKK
jgi:chitodextrinase